MNQPLRYRLLICLLIVLIAGISFWLGTMIHPDKQDGIILSCDPGTLQALIIPKETTRQTPVLASVSGVGNYFASKNGEKYYPTSCAAARNRIKPENMIWFSSEEDATLQGFTRSSSC